MNEYSLAALLDYLSQTQSIDVRQNSYPQTDSVSAAGLLNEKLANMPSTPYAMVDRPQEIPLGIDPNQMADQAMQPYMGAPESYVPTDFYSGNYQQTPITITGGGGSMNMPGAQGFAYGGRVGTEMPLDEQVRLALGIQGTSADVSYGIGTDYAGRANRADITGIDAMLKDLKNNREFGAEVKKDLAGNPFASLLYRQRF